MTSTHNNTPLCNLTLYTLTSVCIFSILFSIHFSEGTEKENLFKNQEPPLLVIISFVLMTLLYDSGMILLGEIRCWSLLGIKGLRLNDSQVPQGSDLSSKSYRDPL